LSISTAASALFLELQVPLPSLNPRPTGKRVLIWGGSSSVGSSAIQLAVAAGLEVVTTARSVNHDFVRSLGASHVLDYEDSDVLGKIAGLLKPGDLVVDSIASQDTQAKCAQILAGLGGGKLPLMMPPEVTMPDNVNAVFGKPFISFILLFFTM
jgi:NADPH:quinone reductase-like Zn-dependent oxidoreductase